MVILHDTMKQFRIGVLCFSSKKRTKTGVLNKKWVFLNFAPGEHF